VTPAEKNDDDSIQHAVRQLFIGSAPERIADLEQMWTDLAPVFTVMPEENREGRFILAAGLFRLVRFNHRALRAFWIGGYAAWEAYRVIAESADLQTFDTICLTALIAEFENVIESEDSTLLPLPAGVSEPGHYPDGSADPHGRTAAELATLAVAWALLHELRHIRHQQEQTRSDPFADDQGANHREELSCDAFATNFLLDEVVRYAAEQGVDAELVRRKRQLGIYFALFTLTLLTKNHWQASPSHPSVQSRIDALKAIMEPTKSEIAAGIAHAAFSTLGMIWRGSAKSLLANGDQAHRRAAAYPQMPRPSPAPHRKSGSPPPP